MTKTKNEFIQLCVWEASIVGEGHIQEFTDWMKKEFDVRVKYDSEVKTLAGNGGEGGRNDLFFYIHSEDIGRFAVPRLAVGIRWWENVLGNGNGHLYAQEFLDTHKPTWNEEAIGEDFEDNLIEYLRRRL